MGLRGTKEYQIDYEVLQSLVSIMCIGEECASVLGMDYETLNTALKRDGNGSFPEYFKRHSGEGKKSLRRAQFDNAINGKNATMQVWLGKQYLGQTDKVENVNVEVQEPRTLDDLYD